MSDPEMIPDELRTLFKKQPPPSISRKQQYMPYFNNKVTPPCPEGTAQNIPEVKYLHPRRIIKPTGI